MDVEQINTTQESDNPSVHRMIMRNRTSEKAMKNHEFERLSIENNGMSIVMEFPKNHSDNSDFLTQDIKDILKNILFEYLEKVS